MQQQLPNNLNYSQVKPVGFPSQVKQEKFVPISFNSSVTGVQSQDVIRFNISSNGFWDPYSAYIKIEVDASQMDGTKDIVNGTACGILQIDNSASSLISQLIIQKSGVEIERIEEYDTLAAILNDVHGSNDNRAVRSHEGMNANQQSFGQQYNNQRRFNALSLVPTNYNQGSSGAGWLPLLSEATSNLEINNYQIQTNNAALASGGVGGSNLNRYEYTLLQQEGKSTVQSSTYFLNNIGNGARNVITATNQIGLSFSGYGYKQPFCPQLSSYGNEATLSKNIYTNTTYKGALNQFIFQDRITFCIPLLSGILGVLMPKESYKYIPMKALQDLIIEFRLSQYAMFTSGYSDAQEVQFSSSLGMNTSQTPMFSRSFKITKFELNVEMQYFESSIENIILSKLNTQQGIVIHSQSWMLGPRYSIPANTSPNGSYQVNLGFESLKNVLFCFIPDDYIQYTFCRKQYRISANITSMYIKVGSEYFPPLPITGHAGCPQGYQSVTNDSDLNNSEFLIQLYKTFGKFNDIQQGSCINAVNFAVNQRAYNPTNTGSLYSATLPNFDTAQSQSIFHENRCVARAAYAMNLETLNQDYSVISGINTIRNAPYEITLKSDNTNAFTRPYTMYVFNNYDLLLQLRDTGVQVLGRG